MLLDISTAGLGSKASTTLPSAAIFIFSGALIFLLTLIAGLFIVLKKKIQLMALHESNREKSAAELASQVKAQGLLVRQMVGDLEELRARVGDRHESIPSAVPLWASADMPVNLNRRGQIIRLSRKGKSISEIAQDLNVAQGEVELMLKVHDLTLKSEQDKSYPGKGI